MSKDVIVAAFICNLRFLKRNIFTRGIIAHIAAITKTPQAKKVRALVHTPNEEKIKDVPATSTVNNGLNIVTTIKAQANSK